MAVNNIEKKCYDLLINNLEFLVPNYLKINYHTNNRESPDIAIHYEDDYSIGIEITLSTDENLEKAKAERNKVDRTITFLPTIFENKKMSGNKIKEHLDKSKNYIFGSAYKGNELEVKVFSNIQLSIEKKVKKFDFYEKFSENWLYVYHSNRVSLDHQIVLELLQGYLKTIDFKFDCIILLLGRKFYKYKNNILYTI